VARAGPLASVLVGLGILVSLVVNGARPLTNTDTYFHLRFGQEFIGGWSIRHPGSVSTFATQHWIPTQWLSEIVMARTQEWFGLAGLAWLSGALEVAVFVALYVAGRDAASPVVVLPLCAASLYAMESGLSMRPQVVSYLMVAVVTAAWLRTRRDGSPRWWLIPLLYLWAMLHGMWPIGIIVGVVAIAGIALDRAPRGVVLRALVVPTASAVAAALTPVGPGLYREVAAVGSRSSFFEEWNPPDYTTTACLTLAILLAATGVAMWKRPRNSWTEVLLVLLAGGFAVYSARTVPVAAAMLVPLGSGPVQDLLRAERPPARRREVVALAGGVVAALAALAVAVPHTAANPPDEPSWLTPSLDRLPAGTKVLDDWSLGGYLMWRYPQLDLMMHGYGDTFTTDELRRNTGLLALDPGWDSTLQVSGARVAVLRPGTRLCYALVSEYSWRVAHSSEDLVLLRAPTSWISDSPPVAGRPGSVGS
jgi:hypothetical protein